VAVAAILFAGLHFIALPMGMGGLFMRGRYLRRLRAGGKDSAVLRGLFAADTFWGIAALLWIITGLTRAFGGVEKQPAFYLRNGMFWIKMGLFLLIFLLELMPMIAFIRWRIAEKKQAPLPGYERVPAFIRINDGQLALLLLMPFVAAAMARGVWLF
jgi:putative membrane protein